MLHRVRLRNFKLHEDTTIEAKPITIFIGSNNSGKSSIFQALMLLKQAKKFKNDDPGMKHLVPSEGNRHRCNIDVGDYNDVLRHNAKEIIISLEGSVIAEELQPIVASEKIQIKFDGFYNNNEIIRHKGTITAGKIEFAWDTALPSNRERSKFELSQLQGAHATISPRYNIYEPIVTATLGFTTEEGKQHQEQFRELAKEFASSISSFFDSFHLVYALRGMEELHSPLRDQPSEALELIKLNDRSETLASTMAYNRSMEDRISEWFHDLLHVDCRTELIHHKRVTLQVKDRGAVNPIINEGMGSNQIPYILIPIALADRGHTIFMEEPEVHLHPKAQSELVKLLLRIYEKEKKQYLIATHSEHILYSFLTAIARGELQREDLAIYYFENIKGKAETTLISIEEDGSIKGGLPGFFEHSVDELLDYLNALDSEGDNEA